MDLGFDVVELEPPEHPTEGAQAPDFTRPLVNSEYWVDTALSALAPPVCLVFHPMDGAFPATYLWSELRDRGFGGLDATVVGLSISTPYAHKRLLADRGDGVRIFSDPGAGVIEEYGLAHDIDGMTGVTESRPAVLLLDDDRTVEHAWVASEHPEFPDAEAIDDAVADLVD